MKLNMVSDWFSTAIKSISLVGVVLMAGCEPVDSDMGNRPDDLLPEGKMAAILTDAHLIEGSRSGDRILGDTLSIDAYYKVMYEKHGISESAYARSFTYYNYYPEKMEGVFQRVVENLSRLEAEVERQIAEEARKKADAVRDTSARVADR